MIEISEFQIFDKRSLGDLTQIKIEKVNCQSLSYDTFHQKFMHQNLPLVIQSIPQKWRSMQTWTNFADELKVTLDFNHLKKQIPNIRVPVADCTKKHLNAHEKFEMNFHEFLDYWEDQIREKNCDKLWYLKDWHLRKLQPSYDFYETPEYFASDWLNEYLGATNQDDYKFVYMGPKGTWTPLHSDVFSSFSWSTNIFGKKEWILIYPEEEKKLLDNLNNLPFSIEEEQLRATGCAYVRLVQNAGDTIFVPTGWFHQVTNVDHTISINHNFFNGCNVSHVWSALLDNYRKVLKEIEECKDMENFEDHCQIMLKALHGMNFKDFFDILKVVIDNRIKSLETENQLLINEFVLGKNLCLFDLQSCRLVLNKVELHLEELNFNVTTLDAFNELKTSIEDELKDHIDLNF